MFVSAACPYYGSSWLGINALPEQLGKGRDIPADIAMGTKDAVFNVDWCTLGFE